jgi:hypothetical protein
MKTLEGEKPMQDYLNRLGQPHGGQPRRIGDILVELLAHYESRFPGARITVIETPEALAAEPYVFQPTTASAGQPLFR